MNELQKKVTVLSANLKVPKSRFNSFGNYNYRSLEDIYEAVKPKLAKYSLILTLEDDIIAVGDRIYVKATATIRGEGDEIKVSAFAREAQVKKGMDDSQITGTASSYARKYALSGLFLLDDTKDADTDEFAKQTQSKSTQGLKKTPKKEDDNKPWLNEQTREWEMAEEFIRSGGDVSQLYDSYKLSKINREYFVSLSNEAN